MLYRVNTPFHNGGILLKRGDVLGPEIEEAKNFRSLTSTTHGRDPWLEPLGDDNKEYVNHCYIVTRRFSGNGTMWKPGDFIDLREGQWRNENSLLKSGYLRRATEDDVKAQAASATSTAVDESLWHDEGYLRREYLERGKGIARLASEMGCSVSTIHSWMKKFDIPRRKRGKQ